MPYIKITAEVLAAIEAERRLPTPKDDPLRRCGDGYEIWVDEDTNQYLNEKALKGETVSDTIMRLVALQANGGRLM